MSHETKRTKTKILPNDQFYSNELHEQFRIQPKVGARSTGSNEADKHNLEPLRVFYPGSQHVASKQNQQNIKSKPRKIALPISSQYAGFNCEKVYLCHTLTTTTKM